MTPDVAEAVRAIVTRMIAAEAPDRPGSVIDVEPWLDPVAVETDPIAAVTASFLVALAGPGHPGHEAAVAILTAADGGPAGALAAFYDDGLRRIGEELAALGQRAPDASARIVEAARSLAAARTGVEARDAVWQAWCPQAVGILGSETERIDALRAARTVTVIELATRPITDPMREVLVTANVLLTRPSARTDIAALPYPDALRAAIHAVASEAQRFWFDHPIQLGVEPASNELLYGLQGLDDAVAVEVARRPPEHGPAPRVTCVLSVSVTHDGLAAVARDYVHAELERSGGLQHVDVVVCTERDTQRLVEEVLAPALALADGSAGGSGATAGSAALSAATADAIRTVFGVDGEYGRHYSFLKAIAAVWQAVIDPRVAATFKFDLDQVFPQAQLLAETGRTAFEHLADPLWGASAIDAEGREIELGMLAGALVNERDIGGGLFSPDVPLPEREPRADERLFWSALPQAISTRAEMMERYDGPIDGRTTALERVHVTGGTNGIRIDALRRHRPFTPSFVGRAEDQAYILSVLGRPGPRLAYAHAAGLIMRHDKEAFAAEAIAAAHVGKLIGDDLRILVFSAYADAAAGDGTDGSLDRAGIRRLLDPFTGAFISDVPVTLVHLRLALRTLAMLASGARDHAHEYAIDGSRRIAAVLDSTSDPARSRAQVAEERAAWDAVYDAVDALERGIAAGDERALRLRERAAAIIDACRIERSRGLPSD